MPAIAPGLFLYPTLSLGGSILNSTLQRHYLKQVASPGSQLVGKPPGTWPLIQAPFQAFQSQLQG